jgi:hypothetical protein
MDKKIEEPKFIPMLIEGALGIPLGVFVVAAPLVHILKDNGFSYFPQEMNDLLNFTWRNFIIFSGTGAIIYVCLWWIKNDKFRKTNEDIKARDREAEIKRKKLELDKSEKEKRILEEQETYRQELQKIEDIEAAKSRGKAKGLAELYEKQIQLMIKYKREGVNIEKEIFSMREKLFSLEREENNAMVQDLIGTLDRL